MRDSLPSDLNRSTDNDIRCSESAKVEQSADAGNLCSRPSKLEINTGSDFPCSPILNLDPASSSNLQSKRSRSRSSVRGLRRGLSSLSSKLGVLSTKGRDQRGRSNISTDDLESVRDVRSMSPAEFHFHASSNGGCNSSLTPITRHYSTNEALLDLFSTLYERDQHSRVTYAVGLQFVETALVTIPAHGYFNDERYAKERSKSTADALAVTRMLGDIVPEGAEDRKVQLGILEGLVQQSSEAVGEDRQGESSNKYEASGQEDVPSVEAAVEDSKGGGQVDETIGNFTSSVTTFLDDYVNGTPHNFCVMPPQIGSLWSMTTTAESEEIDKADDTDIYGAKETESVKVESAPTSTPSANTEKSVQQPSFCSTHVDSLWDAATNTDYQSIVYSSVEAVNKCDPKVCPSSPKDSLEKQIDIIDQFEPQRDPPEDTAVTPPINVEIDPKVASAAEIEAPPIVHAPTSDSSILTVIHKNEKRDDDHTTSVKRNVAVLIDGVREQYQHLRRSGTFCVRFLDTYQGRLPGSTNGCTVIAPLTCIQYFTSPDQDLPGRRGGIPDELINQVIDDESPCILAAVRGQHNLGEGTFIVPSDVHDYLIDSGLLSCGQFVAVCGGDILNDEHLEQFKSSLLSLDGDRDARKVAATLFFHGHVVALHVVKNKKGICMDLIDSLPDPSNWITQSMRRRLGRALATMGSYEEREPTQDTSRAEEIELDDLPQNAVRIRCTDLEHFNILIRYYACNKFSEEERKFIDTHPWEDKNCDFDCRVFQAFVWSEAV